MSEYIDGPDFDDDFDDIDEEDEFERAIADCAMSFDPRTGKRLGCGKAGSEECDFECPYGPG